MKIALIYSFEESNWFSCTKIVKNLLSSYLMAFKNDEVIHYNYNYSTIEYDTEILIDKIKIDKPEKVIFLDHKPHPIHLLTKLINRLPSYEPEINIHIYGDFTLFFNAWEKSNSLLLNKKVKFLCASEAQVELVKKFMESKDTFIKKVPFPVDVKEFNLKKDVNDIKGELGLDKAAKVILYTGRFSMQKKTVELIQTFSQALEEKLISNNTYLLLAGEFDSLGFTFGDVYHHQGEYFREYDRAFNQLPKSSQERIIFLGKIDNKLLINYYNQADVFMSLSTYHDEDYGMSVAEAGISGCALLLSGWAGYKSFQHKNDCELVRTWLGKSQPEVDLDDAKNKLSKVLNKPVDREKNHIEFKDHHSVEAIADLLGKISKEECSEFKGFNSFLFKMGRYEQISNFMFFDDTKREMNQYYYEVYDVYAT